MRKFQSTLSRRERLARNGNIGSIGHISIHALTKRATCKEREYRKHRPHFNPRSHEESDEGMSGAEVRMLQISIHALTKRATVIMDEPTAALTISIHALTKRATAIYSILWLNFYLEVLVILIVLHF